MDKWKRVFIYIFLSVAAFISIFPFLWMIISATNKSADVTKGRLLPGSHLVENITNLFSSVDFVPALLSSSKNFDYNDCTGNVNRLFSRVWL